MDRLPYIWREASLCVVCTFPAVDKNHFGNSPEGVCCSVLYGVFSDHPCGIRCVILSPVWYTVEAHHALWYTVVLSYHPCVTRCVILSNVLYGVFSYHPCGTRCNIIPRCGLRWRYIITQCVIRCVILSPSVLTVRYLTTRRQETGTPLRDGSSDRPTNRPTYL